MELKVSPTDDCQLLDFYNRPICKVLTPAMALEVVRVVNGDPAPNQEPQYELG